MPATNEAVTIHIQRREVEDTLRIIMDMEGYSTGDEKRLLSQAREHHTELLRHQSFYVVLE
jgi:RecA/RadA recombinase